MKEGAGGSRFPPSLRDLTYSPLQWFLLRSDVFTCFQVPPTEQGMRKSTQLAANYPCGYKIWLGPITPMIVFCHPDMLQSITNASGTHAELVVVGVMTHLRDYSPSLPTFYVAPTGPWPPFLSSLSVTSSLLHAFIMFHLTDSFLPMAIWTPTLYLAEVRPQSQGLISGQRHP